MTHTWSNERARSSRQYYSLNDSRQLNIENVGALHFGPQDAIDSSSCLRSLGFLEIDHRENDIRAAIENTCDWLFRTTEFKTWRARTNLATHNGVLCIKGKPGAGKSTLMKHMLAHCKEIFPDHRIAAYFFNARGGALEKTPLGMLRSIIYQLIRQDDALFEEFQTRFRDKQHLSQQGKWEWRLQDLEAFTTFVIKQAKSRPLFLLVDALDECNKADTQHVVDFLESLSSDAICCGATLRICLSRRHYPPLKIQRCLTLTVDDNNDHLEDIAIYIQTKLERRDEEMEAEIKRKAGGIFMWAVLVVSLLNQAYREGDVDKMRVTLQQVPKELEDMFQELLTKDNEHMAETVLLVQCVLFSQRPLKLEELFIAVNAGAASTRKDQWSRSSAIDDDIMQRRIKFLSRGLVEVRGGGKKTVQFIHLSVSDFLLRNKRLQTLESSLEPDPICASHYRLWALCRSCIDQIDTGGTEEIHKELLRKYPFLRYAVWHMFNHAEKVLGEGLSARDDEMGTWLRENNRWFERWKLYVAIYDDDDVSGGFADASLLYVSALWGHREVMRLLLEKGADVNAQGGKWGDALQVASYQGFKEIVELLLENGADVNTQGGYFGNALQAAATGENEVVELLLEKGADINAQGGYYGNALQAASRQGHTEIIELLLEKGADINAQGGKYGNALQAASSQGYEEIIELLLEKGADINAQGGRFGNALQAASANTSGKETVELLLKKGANINAQGGEYGNALQAALNQKNEKIVELLLEKGAVLKA